MNAVADITARRADLHVQVALAAKILVPNWPLERFIAVNPLGGLEDRPFGEALAEAGEWFGCRGTPDERFFRAAFADARITEAGLVAAIKRTHPRALTGGRLQLGGVSYDRSVLLLADLLHGEPAPSPQRQVQTLSEAWAPEAAALINELSAKWCASYLDLHQARWTMPGRERGFFAAWRELAAHDRALPKTARQLLRQLPERADETLIDALDRLELREADRRDYLQAHLTCLPGFSSHIRWRADRQEDFDLVDLLAMRVSYEAALLAADERARGGALLFRPAAAVGPGAGARAQRVLEVLGTTDVGAAERAALAALLGAVPLAERCLIWLEAYESDYRDALLAQLSGRTTAAATTRPDAQVVCCIDARSEGLRRHLESLGKYETLGFAGFFAVAISYRALADADPDALCPVLLEPRNAIEEHPVAGAEAAARRHLDGHRDAAAAEAAFHAAKDDMAAPFVLAESAGWIAGPMAAYKTLDARRYGRLRDRLRTRVMPPVTTALSVDTGFTPEERVLFAEVALTMMGLTAGFAPLVVLCGHGSTTENNPYAAALDCGACGGQRGGPNARTAAAILNEPVVRQQLRRRGITIPDDTWFTAAEHDTTCDRITLLDQHLLPPAARAAAQNLAPDLDRAGAELSAERLADLPGAPRGVTAATAREHVDARRSDWAQVFPEWGLAGNAAFIVGPRSMTAGLDLGRRCFLHSYDASVDAEGDALETILTAPLVVAQWINCQYYFSTVAPDVFGSGTKTIHNVVAGIGVLSGHNGDLQLGLPWQSVAVGDKLMHEPMRLLAVVQAPLARIDGIIERNTVLQQLFGNGWVALAAREHAENPWLRQTADGWEPWTNTNQEVAA